MLFDFYKNLYACIIYHLKKLISKNVWILTKKHLIVITYFKCTELHLAHTILRTSPKEPHTFIILTGVLTWSQSSTMFRAVLLFLSFLLLFPLLSLLIFVVSFLLFMFLFMGIAGSISNRCFCRWKTSIFVLMLLMFVFVFFDWSGVGITVLLR